MIIIKFAITLSLIFFLDISLLLCILFIFYLYVTGMETGLEMKQ